MRKSSLAGVLLSLFVSTVAAPGRLNRALTSSVLVPQSDALQTPERDASSPTGTVYLYAIDKDGGPITDLKEQELRIFEGKVERKIISVSSASDEQLTLGLFFDISGSRRADRSVREEVRAASEFLHSIWRDGDMGFVLAFNDKMRPAIQPTHKLEDVDEGLKKIPDATHWGATALYDALCIVRPEKLNSVPGRKIYIVLSDFEDNSSKNKLENVVELAHEARIAIFPVILDEGFGGGNSRKGAKRAKETAQKIAEGTGGEVLIPESPKQLPAIFTRLSNELHAAYRITYKSELSPTSGKKKLRIEITRPHAKLLFARD